MLRFFKTLQPATLFLIPIILFIFWVRIAFESQPVVDKLSMPLWELLSDLLNNLPSVINFLLLFIVIAWQAVYFNLILNRHEVLYKNTFFPALMYALLLSSTPALMSFHPVHLVNLIVLRILDRAFTLYKSESPASALFDSAFLAGIAALIYFPALVLLPFLVALLLLMLPFRIKDWLILVIGFFLPYFFLSTMLFWENSLVNFWKYYFSLFEDIRPAFTDRASLPLIILGSLIAILLLLSLMKLWFNFRKNKVRTRIMQQSVFILLMTGIAWLVFTGDIRTVHLTFLFTPLAAFTGYYFIAARKRMWIFEGALWVIIVLIAWNHLA